MDIRTLLLVDDNEIDHFLHESVIREFDPDIVVTKVYDGAEALEFLSQVDEQPDIILLDINMPGMNGFEFLEVHEKSPSSCAVIAMLSSSGAEIDKQRASKFECVKSYIFKPLDCSDLEELSKF